VSLSLAPERIHLFDEKGLAVRRPSRHPLADRKVRGAAATAGK
jgi:hypothetical protein